MQIRPTTPADIESLAAVHVAAWRAGYRGVMPDSYLDGLDVHRFSAGWRRMLADPDGPTNLVGVVDGTVVGFATAGAGRDDDTDGIGELWSLNLDPAHWGRGLGSALASAAMSSLADEGYTRATLWVVRSNDRARRTYERLGWIPDGTARTDTIGGGPVDEVRLVADLVPH